MSILVLLVVVITGGFVVFWLFGQKGSTTQITPSATTPVNNAETQNTKRYSTEEVSLHNSKDDCWIVIDNTVYNVSDFVSKHPGGEAILGGCGLADSTDLFATKGEKGKAHSLSAYTLLDQFKIGLVLTEEEPQEDRISKKVTYDQVLDGINENYYFAEEKYTENYIGVNMESNNTIQILGDRKYAKRVGLLYILSDNTDSTAKEFEISTNTVTSNIFQDAEVSEEASTWIANTIDMMATKTTTSQEVILDNIKINVQFIVEQMSLRIDFYIDS